MELSPQLYHLLVRPPLWTKRYIHNVINRHFQLQNQIVMDFGSGVGSNCQLADPDKYIGLEICPKRVKFASQIYPQYRFVHFNGGALPTPTEYVDCILIVAVLHHISSREVSEYIREFRRILKPDGKILVMEPCLREQSRASNWCMKNLDKGKYIRDEQGYLDMFHSHRFETNVLRRFRKLVLYNELFFAARPKY
ncbi:class I SAM-dependent methyltransferase [Alicyclobacillus dauci]|uniref:Class I SAM-dependent methyltransferase n=1 Tax=Alicyclobacillus dauci TaxID=1475485 RepID=A0ABY6Z4V0_9BACL|nr:class I SAM-dependent methyltransferase [Alicyclobacillus dauci]WAH37548.1 class I SAM-dependent methyltransferase [Alicyclobacillus dauci]